MKKNFKRLLANEGKAKAIIIILLILIVIGVCLWFFRDYLFGGSSGGQGNSQGTGTSQATDNNPANTTANTDNTSDNTTVASDNGDALTYTITVSDKVITCNGTTYDTADALVSMLKPNVNDKTTVIIEDDHAIKATYDGLKSALDAASIKYSEKVANS